MLHQSFVTQPSGRINYLSLFDKALRVMNPTRLSAAVAYARIGGVVKLDKHCQSINHQAWERMEKRWLVGIDYCRTQPGAIKRLAEIPNSTVKIHNGSVVVARRRCVPQLSYHPKTFIIEGADKIGAICGSGNLSITGMTKGHEVGNVMIASRSTSGHEATINQLCSELLTWFDEKWNIATSQESILPAYEVAFAKELSNPVPIDDDEGTTEILQSNGRRTRQISPENLAKLRACEHLWIETGKLTENLGDGNPGNQLDLKRMTRVFFDLPADDVPRNQHIDNVSITWNGRTKDACSFRYGHNKMDIIYLPIPSTEGPAKYDHEVLLFTRRLDGGYNLSIGTPPEIASWKANSDSINAHFKMASGGGDAPRQWGVF